METRASTHLRKFARLAMLLAVAAIGTTAGTIGGGEPAWAARVQVPADCEYKIDEIGKLKITQRLHIKCPGKYIRVGVSCSKGVYHQSSRTRYEYNKAECFRPREGYVRNGQVLVYQ